MEFLREFRLTHSTPMIIVSAYDSDEDKMAGLMTGGVASTAVVEVRDHGPDIPDDQLALVFNPFFRGDHDGDRGEGGLGLTAARSIPEVRDWELTVTSPLAAAPPSS